MINDLTPFHALLLVLGIVSVTRLVTSDTFPPIAWARDHVLRRFPHVGYTSNRPIRGKAIQVGDNYVAQTNTVIGSLLHCPYCIGFWISAAAVACWSAWPTPTMWACLVMACRWVTGATLNRFD